MNAVAINRNELTGILDMMPMQDVVWAIRHLSERLASVLPEQAERNAPKAVAPQDLKLSTWMEYGLDEKTAKQCVTSMKDYKAGRYTVCRNKRERDAFFDSL